MKHDILIVGVGGQGILTIATILGRVAIEGGLHLKQSEVHGMAQRGGAVYSHMRISSDAVWSDVIPCGKADMLIAMEPMEALRYLTWVAPGGWLIANEEPVVNIADYPDVARVYAEIRARPRHVLFNATELATKAGAARAVNTALLGVASYFLELPAALFERAITLQFESKGAKIVDANLAVFRAAQALAKSRAAE
jgi:indolepyruvate ferredoxin oxidoreductase, beta subunit